MNDWIEKAVQELAEREHREHVSREYALLCDRLIQSQSPIVFEKFVSEVIRAATQIPRLIVSPDSLKDKLILRYGLAGVSVQMEMSARLIRIEEFTISPQKQAIQKSYFVHFEIRDSFAVLILDRNVIGGQWFAEHIVSRLCGVRRSF